PMSLPPLQRVADEIVFVDTGSTDRTLEIVQDFGCRLFHYPWNQDFSAPKNLALDEACFSWILNVDCDEVLVEDAGWRERILGQCQAVNDPAWIIQIDNILQDGSVMPSKAMRLFKKDPRIRFVNPVHEGVADSVYRHWPDRPPKEIDLRLIHHGYSTGINKEKIRRNVAILRQWIAAEPHNVYGRYKLGMNLRHLGLSTEGLYHLEQAFMLADQDTDRNSLTFLEELISSCYQAYLVAGEQEKAEAMKQTIRQWR
ncbi:MAG: glycosyltransferase, partial [Magnetococcus sp. YQC-5]